MAGPIKPPKITGPTIRPRIPVSDAARKEARAGMGGEQLKATGTTPAADAPPVPTPEPVAPVETAATPELGSSPSEPVATPTNEPPTAATPEAGEPVALPPEPTTTASADEHLATPASAPGLVAEQPAAVASHAEPVPAVPAAASAPARRRAGRKPSPPGTVLMEPEHAVKIAESTWSEIRINLALLPKASDNPANIKKYLELAHKHYEAYLRKQGKLPAK